MSVVHTVATVVTSPTPSPQIIKEVFTNTVPANTPAVVVQAAQVAGLFVTGIIVSVAHRVIEYLHKREDGYKATTNTVIASAYTLLIGAVGSANAHALALSVSGLVSLVLSSGVVSIGTFWSYAVRSKLLAPLVGLVKRYEGDVQAQPQTDGVG